MGPKEIYDFQVPRHGIVFARLGPVLQQAISTYQEKIQAEVDNKNPGRFVPTSGFRCASENQRVGGVPDSMHIWGLARDFAPVDGDFERGPVVCSRLFRVLKSHNCWHVEIKV